MQIVGLIFAMQTTSLINFELSFSDESIVLHLVAIIFFFLGTLLPALRLKRNKSIPVNIKVKKSFYTYSIVLISIGLIISLFQIKSYLSISEYFTLLMNNDSQLMDLRTESGSGGLSGVLKIFAYAPLTVYLVSEGMLFFMQLEPNTRNNIKLIKYIALVISVLKVFLWLDRLTLLAIIITNIYIFLNEKRKKNFKSVLFALPILFIADFVSAKRLAGYSVFDFIILYTKLGVANFQMMIETVNLHTFGLNTFFSPLGFIFKFFGYHFQIESTYKWIWNPAQYMNSFLFQDFGYFSLLVYFFIGWFIKNIEYWASKNHMYYQFSQFIFLFAISTFWFVPIIRAVEFWLMLLIPFMFTRFSISKNGNINS